MPISGSISVRDFDEDFPDDSADDLDEDSEANLRGYGACLEQANLEQARYDATVFADHRREMRRHFPQPVLPGYHIRSLSRMVDEIFNAGDIDEATFRFILGVDDYCSKHRCQATPEQQAVLDRIGAILSHKGWIF